MIKETVVAVSIVTMAAGAALAPSAVSAGEQPTVVADSHEDPCNPCGACNPCEACNPCGGCNPCESSLDERIVVADACNPCEACNPCDPCAACNPCDPCAAE